MVSLYCGLHLLLNVVKRPSFVSNISCSICVNDSRNGRPFLPSQFFMSAIYSACGMLYSKKILFTSSLRFLNLLYLSSDSQLNVWCFFTCLPNLGFTFCVLSTLVTGMTCIAALVASATACDIASLAFACSFPIICICTLFAYVCLYETFYSQHHVAFLP